MIVKAGSVDVTTYFHLRLAADGTDATGLTITNIDLQYVRSGEAPSAKVDATALAATDSAHADNKAIEIDSTDQPGVYRVDWPDAAFAAAREVILTVKCATVFTESLRVQLVAPPADVTHFGGSAGTFASGIPEVKVASIANNALTAAAINADAITAAKIAADVTTELQSGLATASALSSLDAKVDVIDDFLDTEVAAILAAVDTEVAAIKAKTDNLPADPADASDIASSFTTVNGKLDTIDDFLDTEIAAIKTKTDSLTFTVAGAVDANVQRINDVNLTGDGSGTPWGPA